MTIFRCHQEHFMEPFTLPELVEYMEAVVHDRQLDCEDRDTIIEEIRQEIEQRFGIQTWQKN
jgi:hypothetical protein